MNWEKIITWVLIILGIFLSIQLVKVIVGGSWNAEDIIIGLLIFSLGLNITVLRRADHNSHRLDNLTKSFKSLARDFKKHVRSNN